MSYNIGDFIEFERSHLSDTVGVIVNKWDSLDKWNYLVSIKQFNGDYACMTIQNIKGIKNLSVEYKLSLLSSFDDWWYIHHKSIYQNILVCAIK
tara:strand:+ start:593 stop:874 length:282 start_codon:yes stop_codon:yes gene_type:complete